MSLTSSMWTSVSGLLAHGEKMNVIGNNISNVNTVAYKSQRMDFQDFVYQQMGTGNGYGQVGMGTSVGAIMNDFFQGSMESTTNSTDIAIKGNGFFCVKPKNHNSSYYTRAGNFSFNNSGELVDANGYVLQGWKINQSVSNNINRSENGIIGSGSPVDVRLETFTCPPKHTNQIGTPVNLRNTEATADDNSTDETDPFFALLKTWDATQNKPLGSSQSAHHTTMNVYDEGGRMHTLTVYFDRVTNGNGGQNIAGSQDGDTLWEYIITMEPSEDVRDFNSSYNANGPTGSNPNVPDRLKGLLGAGTITFSSTGNMKDMTAFVPHSDPDNPKDQWWCGEAGQETIHLVKWIAAPINSNGLTVVAPNFAGTNGQHLAYKDGNWVGANPDAEDRLIAVDLGLKINSKEWAFVTGPSIPNSAVVKLTQGPLTSDGLPIGPGGTQALDLGGPLYDSSNWASAGTQRIVNGERMTLYLVEDTRDGMPATYYTTQPPADNSGVTVKQSWPVMDPPKPGFDSTASDRASGAPLGKGGTALEIGDTPFFSEADLGASASTRRKDPENPADDLALYLVTSATNSSSKFYIKQSELANYQADPDYLVDTNAIFIVDPIKESLPNTDMLDSKGNPLTANPPQTLNLGGPVYDVPQLPTRAQYPPKRRKDPNGNDMTP